MGYTGDSVINSTADVLWMIFGFGIARRLPVWATVAVALAFELITLIVIRDNLFLNVLMLVSPIDAVRIWQGGA
jgi:purine-cytosine permease-like protein